MTMNYSDFVQEPTQSGFDQLDVLIDRQRNNQLEVDKLEDELRAAKSQLSDVSERLIPTLMDEMGLKKFTTNKGFKVEIKTSLRLSVSGDRKVGALAWLEAHGHGAIIKRTVSVPFAVDQKDLAKELVEELRERYGTAKDSSDVNSTTLKSLVTELMAKGEDVPLSTFGAFEQKTTKISV